jgi:tRNA (cytidine/uridine-2'-O-)-methyltransferase
MMVPLNIVLYEPVIPQNTGSIARLCACTGAALHLIHPLGFSIDEAAVKRAGLDYWPHVSVRNWECWEHFLAGEKPSQMSFFSKLAKTPFTERKYQLPTYLVFGSETKGLPTSLWDRYSEDFVLVPMRTHLVRSLNLSQCVAVATYEAIRQTNYPVI